MGGRFRVSVLAAAALAAATPAAAATTYRISVNGQGS